MVLGRPNMVGSYGKVGSTSKRRCVLLSRQQFAEVGGCTPRLLPPPSPKTPGGVGVGGLREGFPHRSVENFSG